MDNKKTLFMFLAISDYIIVIGASAFANFINKLFFFKQECNEINKDTLWNYQLDIDMVLCIDDVFGPL